MTPHLEPESARPERRHLDPADLGLHTLPLPVRPPQAHAEELYRVAALDLVAERQRLRLWTTAAMMLSTAGALVALGLLASLAAQP